MNRMKRWALEHRVQELEAEVSTKSELCCALETELRLSRKNSLIMQHDLWFIRKAFASFASIHGPSTDQFIQSWSIGTIDSFQRHAMWIGASWGCGWQL